jgi:hypothetical protein
LLHAITNNKLTDPEFEEHLNAFNGMARIMRREWKQYSKEDPFLKAAQRHAPRWEL